MKRTGFLLVTLLLALSMILCGCEKQASDVPAGMQLASSEDADYLFYVPEGWRVDKSSLYAAAYFSSGDATSISVTAFGVNMTDDTVSSWWENYTEQFTGIYEKMEVTAQEEAVLGGIDGMKYTFDATLNEKEYRYIIVAALRENYIYYITYTSTPEYYEDHLDELDLVLEHFAFK
ncbi:MAG: hypothetical protein HFE66_04645 [Clostridiales bacterium]|jgi:hypothetical protein|nr:hypothetical protein [Clostridiales bacterium]